MTISAEDLGGCSGCEMSLLQLIELFLDPDPGLELVHMPLIMDTTRPDPAAPKGEDRENEPVLPQADLGLISGAVRTRAQLHRARALRQSCRTLIALGTCATHGGIPALANLHRNQEILDRCLSPNPGLAPALPPDGSLPDLLPRTYALDEAVEVDILLAGCPPPPELIEAAIKGLAVGEAPEPTGKSVCDTCPTIRGGADRAKHIVRSTDLDPALYQTEDRAGALGQAYCLLEQGLLCLGPVTRAGCGGPNRPEGPRCLRAGVGCRGCFGPVKDRGNQMLDLLNALLSSGVDTVDLLDRPGLLRFSGAHGRLKPAPQANPDRRSGQ